MNNLDKQYQALLQDILDNGYEKGDRTGTGTISIFGRQIRHKMSEGFPLLTTKKIFFKGVITELLWFISGDTNIKYLVDNNCNIWNGDAYKRYWNSIETSEYDGFGPTSIKLSTLTKEEFINKIKTDDEFAKKWGELGPIYGKQWRSWERYGYCGVQSGALDLGMITKEEYEKEKNIDQIQKAIDLLKTDPDSRRNRVSAWNASNLDDMTLPPCHTDFQFYTRELKINEKLDLLKDAMGIDNYEKSISDIASKNGGIFEYLEKHNIPTRAISLMFNMRSNDVPLGLPFNIASYGLLLEIIGRMVNMMPDELIANLGDAHIYLNQIDAIKEQLTREPFQLPKLIISEEVNFNGTIDDFLNSCEISSFKIDGYESHPAIKMPLSN